MSDITKDVSAVFRGVEATVHDLREQRVGALKERDAALAERDVLRKTVERLCRERDEHWAVSEPTAVMALAIKDRNDAMESSGKWRVEAATANVKVRALVAEVELLRATLAPLKESRGVHAIGAERVRQINDGRDDAQWTSGELVWAAMHYAMPEKHPRCAGDVEYAVVAGRNHDEVRLWPSAMSGGGKGWGQPKTDWSIEKRLAVAGALIAAELDRVLALPKPLTREQAIERLRPLAQHHAVQGDAAVAEALNLLLGAP